MFCEGCHRNMHAIFTRPPMCLACRPLTDEQRLERRAILEAELDAPEDLREDEARDDRAHLTPAPDRRLT